MKGIKKIRSSTKIAIGFVALAALSYYGLRAYSNWRVSNFHFSQIKPGTVNLVGVDLGRGFRIVVANQVAQLRQVTVDSTKEGSGFSAGADDEGDSADGKRSRVPMRELLKSLGGDEDALSKFVMILNDIKDDNLPPERVYWNAADIEKAIDSPGPLRDKLQDDLNAKLDGTPLPELRIKSLEDGIVIKLPIPVKVNVAGVQKTLTATVLQAYKPRFLSAVESHYEKKSGADRTMQLGYYVEEAKKILDNPKYKEDIAGSLKDLMAPKHQKELADDPERVLSSATVVVNDSMITSASYNTYSSNGKTWYNLSIKLNDEGSNRLWKYSKDRVGTQLLLVADGIPIAAPRIGHELAENSLDITQMGDQVLVQEAVDMINKKHGGANK